MIIDGGRTLPKVIGGELGPIMFVLIDVEGTTSRAIDGERTSKREMGDGLGQIMSVLIHGKGTIPTAMGCRLLADDIFNIVI